MGSTVRIQDLESSVVVLTDADDKRSRFVVDRVASDRLVVSYVFHGRQAAPVRCAPGDLVELGSAADTGWIRIDAVVEAVAKSGSLILAVKNFEVVQRRRAYREDLVIPFALRKTFTDTPRRGRTDNLSIGGFAGRVEGLPVNDGTEVLVSFNMPEGDELHVVCAKVAGDIQQRFRFLDLDRRAEDRFARLVRAAELDKRRSGRMRE